MQAVEKILKEMDSTLDLLIENAEKLQEISRRVIAQEELTPLQKKQEELISKLMEMDAKFYNEYPKEAKSYHSDKRDSVADKLEKFQVLNAKFVNNITSRQGLIQFEMSKDKRHKK